MTHPVTTGVPDAPETTASSAFREVAYAGNRKSAPTAPAPMETPLMQQVVEAARRELNQMSQDAYPDDYRSMLLHDVSQVPNLALLFHVLRMPEEDWRRTACLERMVDLMVDIAVFVPGGERKEGAGINGDLGRPMSVQWNRSRYEFVAWESRRVPIHVAIMLLNQLNSYRVSMNVRVVTHPSGMKQNIGIELQESDRPTVGFDRFYEPTPEQLSRDSAKTKMSGIAVAQTSVAGHGSSGVRFNFARNKLKGASQQQATVPVSLNLPPAPVNS